MRWPLSFAKPAVASLVAGCHMISGADDLRAVAAFPNIDSTDGHTNVLSLSTSAFLSGTNYSLLAELPPDATVAITISHAFGGLTPTMGGFWGYAQPSPSEPEFWKVSEYDFARHTQAFVCSTEDSAGSCRVQFMFMDAGSQATHLFEYFEDEGAEPWTTRTITVD